ncbi:MAG: hypothetical protein HKN01_11185, partial [Acidimicrobiia bacterium]|nr:hypothetical protein [Acidimicrobiia bacterium]
MTRKPNQPPEPGQTGEWFMNVVTPETVSAADLAPAEPFAPAPPAEEGPPADVFGRVDDTFTNWEPTAMSAVYRSKRTWRWSIIIGALLIAGIVGTVLWWAPQYVEDRIDERRSEFGASALALQGTLPAAAEAIVPVTGPDSSEALTSINAIAGLQDAAIKLDDLATVDHPAGLPFIGTDPA